MSGSEAKAGRDLESYTESTIEMFSPNLSLNIGIKRRHPAVFALVAAAGFLLQAGVLAFAAVVTYYLKWTKEGRLPDPYACPLVIIGTVLLCGGVFLCAYVVGQSTQEQVYDRAQDGRHRSTIYWLQPGGQVLGDQNFHSFSYNDREKRSLERYTTSWKKGPQRSQRAVGGVVCITIAGFMLQFIGLRGIHSAVSIAQLGAVMVMSLARAALRMQRLKPGSNLLETFPDQMVGHELDWLAFSIGEGDFDDWILPDDPEHLKRHNLWRFSGPSKGIIFDPPSDLLTNNENVAAKLFAYRSRLAELTESPPAHFKLAPAWSFDTEMVEVRRMAQTLAVCIEYTVNYYSERDTSSDKWHNSRTMYWGFNCAIMQKKGQPIRMGGVDFTTKSSDYDSYLQFTRSSGRWKLLRPEQLEALLGLWLWSLRSDPEVEGAAEIPAMRIVATDAEINEIKNELKGFDYRVNVDGLRQILIKASGHHDQNTIWRLDEDTVTPHIGFAGPGNDGSLHSPYRRLFGWNAIRPLSLPSSVWALPCESSLLSLCAQEVFASSLVDLSKNPNRYVAESALVKAITEAGLGSREDGALCVVPPLLSHDIRTRRK
ncbi:hypothetical protein DM02DRAFT_653703 [Periconia macrospinosa]|uniref:Uncharacterized protein n=1 Tax=Periconia macrospinosa TaxID=97972 RepID=A0A2V1DW18_9PLEO|nr:hypothetical protein DM02DRAFT_653703 [Periconia macrospinosa]